MKEVFYTLKSGSNAAFATKGIGLEDTENKIIYVAKHFSYVDKAGVRKDCTNVNAYPIQNYNVNKEGWYTMWVQETYKDKTSGNDCYKLVTISWKEC